MKTSEQINELAAALAKAAQEFPPIPRNCEAKIRGKDDKPGRTYHYADLDDVLSAVRVPLAKNGLVLTFDCRVTEQPFVAFVTARLCHASGQWKESEPLPIPCEGFMSTAQQIGSANTYGKRYTAQNMLGISTEQDDDGATAGGLDDVDTGRRAQKPACPGCGTSMHVYEDRQKGGFFCWKAKGGCGQNWLPGDEQPPADPPKVNGKKSPAKEIADQHGMQTADQLEDSQWVKAIKQKLDAIDRTAPNAGERLTKAEDYIYEQHKAKAITDAEKHKLDFLVAEIQKEIDVRANCMETDPATV